MQLETKAPAGRAFATSGNPFENFVLLDASIIADRYEGRIHKADAAARSKATEQIQAQPAQQARHSLHEPSIADELWKFSPQIPLHMVLEVGFKRSILALMKVDHYGQCFTVTQLPSSLSPLAAI